MWIADNWRRGPFESSLLVLGQEGGKKSRSRSRLRGERDS